MDYNGYIYYTAWISLFSSLYGFHRGHSDLALLQGLAFLTSVNYWRNPVFGCRRNTDISVVLIVVSYHSLYALTSENGNEFYKFLSYGMISYALSWYCIFNKRFMLSAYLHNCIHISLFFSSMYLYSGSVQKINLLAPFLNMMDLEN